MNKGLLLTRNWRDEKAHLVMEFWFLTESGPQYIEIRGERPVFFVADLSDDALQLLQDAAEIRALDLTDYRGQGVSGIYFNSWARHQFAAKRLVEAGLHPLEADVKPTERFLMERFIKGYSTWDGGTRDSKGGLHGAKLAPTAKFDLNLSILSFDIETNIETGEVLSIACALSSGESCVWMVGPQIGETFVGNLSEAECIEHFIDFVAAKDPDILTGWNVVNFDLWVLEQRCAALNLTFKLGRRASDLKWREDVDGRRYVFCSGRSVVDGMDAVKSAGYHFESYSLDFVASALLGRGKLIDDGHTVYELMSWYHSDPERFAKYNLVDAELVLEIINKADLLGYLCERSSLTGAELHRVGGSVMQFEFMYLPLMHRAGYVAPRLGQRHYDTVSPGGFVMDSDPGLFQNVLVLDFKSLYPSIIRTFKVDPVAQWGVDDHTRQIVPGFDGAQFDADKAILPAVIDDLWAARDQAKAAGNTPASTALKIIMNSCYGVLGSSGCRFYDPALSSSITKRGHEILQLTRQWIEALGWRVIYGDTDSVFVLLGTGVSNPHKEGETLQAHLNQRWQTYLSKQFGITSHLELEFETCFETFFMPTMRHRDTGSKKRYAGLVVDESGDSKVVFKGMENVRSDWTPLAKRLQEQLFKRVFYGEGWRDWLDQQVTRFYAGEFDAELVYSKRLRKPVGDYIKIIPPHVQAANQLKTPQLRGERVRYVMTSFGVLNARLLTEDVRYDYEHYMSKQLAPALDSLLVVLGTSLEELVSTQIGLGF